MNNRNFGLNILLLLYILFIPAHGLFSQYSSYRIFPSNTMYQYEPMIVVSPINPQVMFCSSNTYDGGLFMSEGVFVTTNGGQNWFGNDTCTGTPINNHSGDPGIAIDKNGIFYLKHISYNSNPGVFAHFSSNMGNSWSGAYPISPGTNPEDKGTLVVDNLSSSPFYGRVYVTGVNYNSPFPVLFSYSTNSGTSWSSYSAINGSPPARCSGGELATGPNGQVYNVWAGDSSFNVPSAELYAGFGTSTNGGVNWNISQNIFSMHGIGGFLSYPTGDIYANGIPRIAVDLTSGPRSGWIYIITNEINFSPAGSDPDIILHRSTNGGQSWSNGIRVNQDPVNNGKRQFFPAICIDSAGAVDIVYYDNRITTSDSADIFLSRSTDGGSTWIDTRISDRRFQPKQISSTTQKKMGDFIGVTSVGNFLIPVWMADYTGRFQVWSIKYILPIGIQKISTQVPEDYRLKQNYPNPFNPSTTIEFSVPRKDNIKIVVYDALGKEVNTIVNQQLEPGSYKVNFEPGNLASGIYYYSLITNDYSATKKMVLVK